MTACCACIAAADLAHTIMSGVTAQFSKASCSRSLEVHGVVTLIACLPSLMHLPQTDPIFDEGGKD